jgi:hypothetical protein
MSMIAPSNSIGSVSPSMPYLTVYEESNATNWTITIAHYSSTEKIALNEVVIQVKNATGVFSLPSLGIDVMTPGHYYNGISFTDMSDPGFLNVGDYVTMNRTLYEAGSTIAFATPDFTGLYSIHTIGSGPAPPISVTSYAPIILIIVLGILSVSVALYLRHARRKNDKGDMSE